MTTPDRDNETWYLAPITEIPGVRHALIMTLDGMVQARSEDLPKDAADGIAAMTSSLHAASRAASIPALEAPADSPIETVTVKMEAGTYMVMPAGANTLIAAAGDDSMPMGVVAHTMARQAMKLGEQFMSVSARVNDGAS
ncbi:roadblock/LC7 domain-containing protein [Streptomyces acidicola]|uniref:Roadblock/LC7 domain-containing protein n=1 Tax=Streptomyces acidicola TaxID=2596892 RepID=A0A5N8WLN7_9ACTN|nr:roadblock/LC7 domain-containing protein [Streptomyces acidicola]MPY48363.1 roadblock/LC7 domain-containing protein [Streptomyces acidicola]